MEILAGIVSILASFVLIMASVRMVQNELGKGKKMDLTTWLLFTGVVLCPAMGIWAGIYLIFFH